MFSSAPVIDTPYDPRTLTSHRPPPPNTQEDKALLRQELPNLRPECLRVLEVATTLLQAGAAAGLTLYELASVMTRGVLPGGDEEPSELETMVAAARGAAEAVEEEVGRRGELFGSLLM